MLLELHIENLALIEQLHIAFHDGLSVITGETGAGKSIMLQALHLLVGGRGSGQWVRTGTDRAVVEALFSYRPASPVASLLRAHDLEDDQEQVILRRVLSPAGKSRGYINGSPATNKLLRKLGTRLLNVASQHDQQTLLQPEAHLLFIDDYGGLASTRSQVAELYRRWRAVRRQYAEVTRRNQEKAQRRDWLLFQCREIEEAAITAGEDQDLDQRKKRLRAAEELSSLGRDCRRRLEQALNDYLQPLRKDLERMAHLDSTASPLATQATDHVYQLEDVLRDLHHYLDGLPRDMGELESVTARIHQLQQLKRKYGPTLDDVERQLALNRAELAELDSLDDQSAALAAAVDEAATALRTASASLSDQRRQAAAELAAAMTSQLRSLTFDRAEFTVDFTATGGQDLENISERGWDRPVFQFSANPGEPPKPLAGIASGGELSRLLLAFKCLMAGIDQVETVIFDEIDAGTSGRAAEAVAAKLLEAAGSHQVLCVTHLPQIASRATNHYLVSKEIVGGRTVTRMRQLAAEERAASLATMLAGEGVTDRALAYVRELLDDEPDGKQSTTSGR